MSTDRQDRNPYVGYGEDGARRSAQIDREEADAMAWDDDRIPRCNIPRRRGAPRPTAWSWTGWGPARI